MSGRTLLYGADGQTPIATEAAIQEETLALLVEAFGFVTGIVVGGAAHPTELEMLMDASRSRLIMGIPKVPGASLAIEARFGVKIRIDPETGELVVDGAFKRPPGRPVGPAPHPSGLHVQPKRPDDGGDRY